MQKSYETRETGLCSIQLDLNLNLKIALKHKLSLRIAEIIIFYNVGECNVVI